MNGLCSGCFNTHFPQPNMKICKLKVETIRNTRKLQAESSWPPRLRGGTGNAEGDERIHSMLITRAIESARKHGINLVHGTQNKGDGNCAFDSVISNINDRICFSGKLDLSSQVYRQIWVTELEMENSKYPRLGAGYTIEEKREHWNHLKQSGVYEVDFLVIWLFMQLLEVAIRIS